jgi:L-ascorbate metabolism protein UlaG (beta-lactamase superfamily)
MTHRFANPDRRHRPHGAAAILRWGVTDRLRGRRRRRAAGPPAPRVEPDRALIHERSDLARLTWIGHASFLATLGGASVLIDPVFASHAGLLYGRYAPPGLALADLPPLAGVLVSHNHYDHFDSAAICRLPPNVPTVVPVGMGRAVRRLSRRTVVELDWWQAVPLGPLEITLVPARHWSRRRVFDTNRALWGGFVVRAGGTAVYHAGDTAAFDGFAEIGRRFPGLAAALLPVGGYDPAWFMEHYHLNPEHAGEAFLTLGARIMVPMHWGVFHLTDEPLAEPVERLRAWWDRCGPRDGRRLIVPAVGETVVVGDAP